MRKAETWFNTIRSSVFALKGRRETVCRKTRCCQDEPLCIYLLEFLTFTDKDTHYKIEVLLRKHV